MWINGLYSFIVKQSCLLAVFYYITLQISVDKCQKLLTIGFVLF